MTSVFSNIGPNAPKVATFKKHHVHEVVNTLAESKQLALDYAQQHRYQHRANVVIVGNSTIRPYDPIYLDGLPNGMSGYWTVLSVKHVLGGSLARYLCELEVGTNALGDVNPNAVNSSGLRDVQGELAGQSLTNNQTSMLVDRSPYINASSLTPSYGATTPTPVVSPPNPSVPNLTNQNYPTTAPNLTQIKFPVQWMATSKGQVLL